MNAEASNIATPKARIKNRIAGFYAALAEPSQLVTRAWSFATLTVQNSPEYLTIRVLRRSSKNEAVFKAEIFSATAITTN
jgi:hypothetical protein